jgi:hypothetical protein
MTYLGPRVKGRGAGNIPFIGKVQLPTTAGGSGIPLLSLKSLYASCPFVPVMIGGAGEALFIPEGGLAAGGGTGLADGLGPGGGGGGTDRPAPPPPRAAGRGGGASSSSSESGCGGAIGGGSRAGAGVGIGGAGGGIIRGADGAEPEETDPDGGRRGS